MPINPATFVRDIEDRRQQFFAALEGEDDLGVVIRAHIHVEHALNEFLLVKAPKAEQLKLIEFGYDPKLTFALAIGLRFELKKPLSALGALRNKFAHTLDMKLSTHVANNYLATFTSEQRQDLQQAYESILDQEQYASFPKSLKHLDPKRLFGTCVLIPYQGVLLDAVSAYIDIHMPHLRENQTSRSAETR